MEAWVMVGLTVLAFVYQVVVGPRSISQWRHAEKEHREQHLKPEISLDSDHIDVSSGDAFFQALRDAYRELPRELRLLVRILFGFCTIIAALIMIFGGGGITLWLIGKGMGVPAMAAFGKQTAGAAGIAILYSLFGVPLLALVGLCIGFLYSQREDIAKGLNLPLPAKYKIIKDKSTSKPRIGNRV